jgi:hypothetical protein
MGQNKLFLSKQGLIAIIDGSFLYVVQLLDCLRQLKVLSDNNPAKAIKNGTVTRRITTPTCHVPQDSISMMPKREQEQRRYTVSAYTPPSSSAFKSSGFQNSLAMHEAHPVGTGVMMKQDKEGLRNSHSLSECSSELDTDVNGAAKDSDILVIPHGRMESGMWNGSDGSDIMSDNSTPIANECASTQEANGQDLHCVRSQSMVKHKISEYDNLSGRLLQSEQVRPGAIELPQTLQMDKRHHTSQQNDNKPVTHSLAMTVSRLLVDSPFPEQNIQHGRKYATHISPSPSVDIHCTAHSSETTVVGAEDISMLQTRFDNGDVGKRLVEYSTSKLREVSNVPGQQKEYDIGSEQAGSYDDKVSCSDCDLNSSSSSESLTDVAIDDTQTISHPTVGETVSRHGMIVYMGKHADDLEVKSPHLDCKPAVGNSHPKVPLTSTSSARGMSMGQTFDESVRNEKERSLAEANLAVCSGIR